MENNTEKKEARRYNSGKIRYELISSIGLERLAEVYTKGADKYTIRDNEGKIIDDGADNWRNGQPWMGVIASVQRHIEAWKKGEDIDPDLGTRHLANAAWGLFTLLDFEKTFPQGDNRNHSYLKHHKIGLDIDDVLADWVGHWTKYHKQDIPTAWNFDRDINSKFETLKDNEEFWLSIPVKTKPQDIPFEPHAYITSRSISKELTERWLDINGFPAAPVYSIGHGKSKVEVAKESGIDIFVDDRFANFTELNNAGICCYLFDAPHNQRYNVGSKRICSLKELL
jgi:5'(3')-deoxyribonucleotidase